MNEKTQTTEKKEKKMNWVRTGTQMSRRLCEMCDWCIKKSCTHRACTKKGKFFL